MLTVVLIRAFPVESYLGDNGWHSQGKFVFILYWSSIFVLLGISVLRIHILSENTIYLHALLQ
jgi:hypothetical protein